MTADSETFAPVTDSTADEATDVLQARLDEDGYLCMRGLVPIDLLMNLRRDILEVCREAGWLDESADLMEGVAYDGPPLTEGDSEFMAVYKKVIHLDSFEAFPQDAVFLDLMTRLLGSEALNHRLRIGRIVFPQNVAQTTAAHQDFTYIKGTPETYTIWSPLGDCPRSIGGLAVLRSSHRLGLIEHTQDTTKKYAGWGVNDTQWTDEDVQWVSSEMSAGDVLIFHAYTVHKGLPNTSGRLMRLSVDNRYQRASEPVEPHNATTHYNL